MSPFRFLREMDARFWNDPWWLRAIIAWVLAAPTLGYAGSNTLAHLIGQHPITLGLGILSMAPLIACPALMIAREKTPEGNPLRGISPLWLLMAAMQICVITTTIPIWGITVLAGESPGTFLNIAAALSPMIALLLPTTLREIWKNEKPTARCLKEDRE